jgi:epoxyqueuosine reductase
VRNACIAAGNSQNVSLVPSLARLAGDDSPVVAEAARWALAELSALPCAA